MNFASQSQLSQFYDNLRFFSFLESKTTIDDTDHKNPFFISDSPKQDTVIDSQEKGTLLVDLVCIIYIQKLLMYRIFCIDI